VSFGMVAVLNFKGLNIMARDPIQIRGDSIIGIYPDDFEKGHVPGRRGTRRVLCKKSTFDSLPGSEQDDFISKLYYKKKREIADERDNSRRLKEKIKRNKKKATIREAADVWLEEIKKLQSKETARDYNRSIKLYIKINKNHLIKEFDRAYNVDFLHGLANTKNQRKQDEFISMDTQHKHARVFRILLNWCHASDYLDAPKKVIMPKVPKKEMETFTIDQVNLLEEFLKHQASGPNPKRLDRKYCNLNRAFILARHTILRTGAIWSLKLENIDLEKGIIRIRDNPDLNWSPKKLKWPNKPINKTLMNFLVQDLKWRSPEEKYFLDNGKGGPWSSDTAGLTRGMKECCMTLGLPKGVKPFHWGVRATFITWLLNNGVDPVKVQHLADHSTLATTMLYFNTRQNNQQIAADMLG